MLDESSHAGAMFCSAMLLPLLLLLLLVLLLLASTLSALAFAVGHLVCFLYTGAAVAASIS